MSQLISTLQKLFQKHKTGIYISIGVTALVGGASAVGYLYGAYQTELKNKNDESRHESRYGSPGKRNNNLDSSIMSHRSQGSNHNHVYIGYRKSASIGRRSAGSILDEPDKDWPEETKEIIEILKEMVKAESLREVVSVQIVEKINHLVYDLTEENILKLQKTYSEMRKNIYRALLSDFEDPSIDPKDSLFTPEIFLKREDQALQNLDEDFTPPLFFSVTYCVQTENEEVTNLISEKLRDILYMIGCPEERYQRSFEVAARNNQAISQISLKRMQGLVKKMKQSPPDVRRSELGAEEIKQVLRFKIKAFKRATKTVNKIYTMASQDPNFKTMFEKINQPQVKMAVKQKLLEDLISFVYLVEPQDLAQKMALCQYQPDVRSVAIEFINLVMKESMQHQRRR